jgi:hypothetical protein
LRGRTVLRLPLGIIVALSSLPCLPARYGFGLQQGRNYLSPPLPIISHQRFALLIPKEWKVRTLHDEAWDRASYNFDLVQAASKHSHVVGIEVLMHAIGRARRHGDLAGEPLETKSGLRGIVHHAAHPAIDDNWYFSIPYPKTESAIIVRVLFNGTKVEAQRKVAYSLFKSVRFVAQSKHRSVHDTIRNKL